MAGPLQCCSDAYAFGWQVYNGIGVGGRIRPTAGFLGFALHLTNFVFLDWAERLMRAVNADLGYPAPLQCHLAAARHFLLRGSDSRSLHFL